MLAKMNLRLAVRGAIIYLIRIGTVLFSAIPRLNDAVFLKIGKVRPGILVAEHGLSLADYAHVQEITPVG